MQNSQKYPLSDKDNVLNTHHHIKQKLKKDKHSLVRSVEEISVTLEKDDIVTDRYSDQNDDVYLVETKIKKTKRSWEYCAHVFFNDDEIKDDLILLPDKEIEGIVDTDENSQKWKKFLNKAAQKHISKCNEIVSRIEKNKKINFKLMSYIFLFIIILGIGSYFGMKYLNKYLNSEKLIQEINHHIKQDEILNFSLKKVTTQEIIKAELKSKVKPDWIKFDSQTLTLHGTHPPNLKKDNFYILEFFVVTKSGLKGIIKVKLFISPANQVKDYKPGEKQKQLSDELIKIIKGEGNLKNKDVK